MTSTSRRARADQPTCDVCGTIRNARPVGDPRPADLAVWITLLCDRCTAQFGHAQAKQWEPGRRPAWKRVVA